MFAYQQAQLVVLLVGHGVHEIALHTTDDFRSHSRIRLVQQTAKRRVDACLVRDVQDAAKSNGFELVFGSSQSVRKR